METTATAWILSITDTLSVAVGEFELVHILPDSPELFTVPKTPAYCHQVFVWQNKIVPLMNLVTRFISTEQNEHKTHELIAIFAYRTKTTQTIEYGALLLNATPHRYEVNDNQVCPLPSELATWLNYVRCCFQDTTTKQIIPIIKLEHLFASLQEIDAN